MQGDPRVAHRTPRLVTAVADRLARFLDKAGRITASLVALDVLGNLTTPGKIVAGIAKMGNAGTLSNEASFGHSSTTFGSFSGAPPHAYPALRQGPWGAGYTVLTGDAVGGISVVVDETGKMQFHVSTVTIARDIAAVASFPASAILQIHGTDGGLLPPRLTTAERDAIAGPVAGLVIRNTTTARLEEYDGSAWREPGRVNGSATTPNVPATQAFDLEVADLAERVCVFEVVLTRTAGTSSDVTVTMYAGDPNLGNVGYGEIFSNVDTATPIYGPGLRVAGGAAADGPVPRIVRCEVTPGNPGTSLWFRIVNNDAVNAGTWKIQVNALKTPE